MEEGGGSVFFAGSSTAAARREEPRLCEDGFDTAGLAAAGLSTAAGSSVVIASRWPSYTVVSQERSFSVRPAQIFAAAAASPSGPATSRSCMPSPLLASLITMIGRNVASAALDLDFSSPRHSARKPLTELAPPTSTPNSVRCTASLGAVAAAVSASVLSEGEAAATTSGIGDAVNIFSGLSGLSGFAAFSGLSGSISFEAAASGGPIIDFSATSGAAGVMAGVAVAAGGFDGFGATDATVVLNELRDHGIAADRAYGGRSGKKQWGAADKSGAVFGVMLAPREAAEGKVAVKDLRSGEQIEVARSEVASWLRERTMNLKRGTDT